MTIEEIIDFLEMKSQLEPENEDIFNNIVKVLEPCEDCISRKAAIDGIKSMPNANPSYWNKCDVVDREDLIDGIQTLPPVVPKGVTVTDFADKCRECGKQEKSEWVFEKTKFDKYGCTAKCLSCNKKWKTYDEIMFKKENKYCPNCGAKKEEIEG